MIINVAMQISLKRPVLCVEILSREQIIDEYGLTYSSQAMTYFERQMPDFIYYTETQVQQASAGRKYGDQYTSIISKVFLVVYFINMCNRLTLTFDSVVMFSVLRYLNIQYPDNLEQFFHATDSFRLSIEIIDKGNPHFINNYTH